MDASLLRWIVALPLLGATVLGLGGGTIERVGGRRLVSILGCLPVGAAFLLSLGVLGALLRQEPDARVLHDVVWNWIEVAGLRADVAFLADPLSATLLLVVTGVGGLIHLYSIGYMSGDRAYPRFFALLNLFTAMMLTLVLADNLLLLFVGWEGVGLCSWALIGFWHHEPANAAAGTKAFLVNRIGDFGLLLGVFVLFWGLGEAAGTPTLIFRELREQAPLLLGQTVAGMGLVTLATALVLVGATGKSAQIPLFVWLPDAMAGPTPVSALIHAATMVTAGVYLITRLSFLFAMAPVTLLAVGVVGGLTALLGAWAALSQDDIKKVLAYSTVSQLGFLFLGLGAGAWVAAIFHLVTHAFFKAALFLGAGSVIHALDGEQDVRRMGGLAGALPWTFRAFVVSSAALAGIFPLSGFFSKDEILWAHMAGDHGFVVLALLGLLVAGMTAFYMTRLVVLVFLGEHRVAPGVHPHEAPWIMGLPVLVLAALAVVGGGLNVPSVLGGSHRLADWLAPSLPVMAEVHGGLGELAFLGVSMLIAVGGILAGASVYLRGRPSPDWLASIGGGVPLRLSREVLGIDRFYRDWLVAGVLRGSAVSAWFDRVVVDGVVNGAAWVTRAVARGQERFDRGAVDGLVNLVAGGVGEVGLRLRGIQSGNLSGYLYGIVIGLVAMLLARLAWIG